MEVNKMFNELIHYADFDYLMELNDKELIKFYKDFFEKND